MSKATRFVLKNVRLSYPALDKARPGMTGGEEKFSANFIIEKSDVENNKVLREKLIAALGEKFPDRAKLPALLRNSDLKTYLSPDGKAGWPLRDGDFMDKDGYEGTVFIRAANKMAPFTIDSENHPCSPKNFYAGCFVDAALEAYAWENASSGTKGVSITLHGVKFAGDGESFGAAPVSSTEFFGGSDDYEDPSNYNV
jgi:hypothetical protein